MPGNKKVLNVHSRGLKIGGMPDAKQRYLFIDLLRFVAAFFMIEGHVVDALLSAQLKAGALFRMHDFFHGFVAPAFLFASGVAYGASTMKRWEDHTAWGKRPRTRVLRFLGLIAIGYALHLPYFSLRKTWDEASSAEIKSFLQSDVLQCIGITLLLLQLSILLAKNRKVFLWVVAGAAAAVIFSAPLMWSGNFSGYLPTVLVAYLSPETGSWFPLFPWCGYILCGVLLGCVLSNPRTSASTGSVMFRYAILNAATFAVAWSVMYLPFSLYRAHDFWKSNPSMFFVRLSAVGIAASLIFLVERVSKAIPSFPLVIGRESLFIYILHLLVVYGSVVNPGLARIIGPTLGVGATVGVFVLVCIVMALITVLWHRVKTDHQTVAAGLTFAMAATFLLLFAIRPW
jgi:uncharacterized membrane protein